MEQQKNVVITQQKLHNLNATLNIGIKEMNFGIHLGGMGGEMKSYKILATNLKGKDNLRDPGKDVR